MAKELLIPSLPSKGPPLIIKGVLKVHLPKRPLRGLTQSSQAMKAQLKDLQVKGIYEVREGAEPLPRALCQKALA